MAALCLGRFTSYLRLHGLRSTSINCKRLDSSKADKERDLLYSSPYVHINKKDRHYLKHGIYEDDIDVNVEDKETTLFPQVDPEQAPYSYIYKDKPDFGWFTRTESITEKEPERWFWVDRLLPKVTDSPHLKTLTSNFPSGYEPQPQAPPDLPYFVNRTRNGIFPVYKIVHQSEERGIQTQILHIEGDIWRLEADLRAFMKESCPDFNYEPAVYEARGSILIRNDCTLAVVDFLKAKGF